MKRFILLLVAMMAAIFAAPAMASAWTIETPQAPNGTVEVFGYGTGTGHTTTGASAWKAFSVTANDGVRRNVNQSNPSGLNGWTKQWDDGSALGATEQIDTWSDLRVRFGFTSTGRAVGTYESLWRFTNSNASNSPKEVTLKAYVQPWNQCTDGLDNDGDGNRDWKKGAGGSTAAADLDCVDMNDTTEGTLATPPAAPTNLGAQAGNGQVTVSWTDNATNEADYLVQYSTNQSNWTDTTAAANATSKVVTGLTNGTLYYFRVAARNSAGTVYGTTPGPLAVAPQGSPPPTTQCSDGINNDGTEDNLIDMADPGCTSSSDDDETDPQVAPAAPSGLGLTVQSTTRIDAAWTDNSNNETKFEVQRDTSSSFTSPVTVDVIANGTSLISTGLSPDTVYYFRVRAVNAAGNSSYSAVASAKTDANPTVQCSDGINNDGTEDNLVDYPDDPGCTSASDDSESPNPNPGGSWRVPLMSMGMWYWQLQGALDETLSTRAGGVNVLDVDADNVTASEISTWKAHRAAAGGNPYAICYVSAGTAENFRPDFSQFQAIDQQRRQAGDSNGIMGAELPDWPGEFWLDGQDYQYFKHIIDARIDKCVADGFDAIEFDNVDGYTNDPQTLTAAEQLTYNRALAGSAHAKGMGVGLKNDVDQLSALQPDFDFAINEQCRQFTECGGYSVFTGAGKPVYRAEYGTRNTTWCNEANTAGHKLAFYALALSATSRYEKC